VTTRHKRSRDEVNRQVEAAFARQKRGELEAAAAVYRQVLAENPDHAAALHYLGLIARRCGNPREALRLLERSVGIDPTDPSAHDHLGQIHTDLNDRRSAALCFERALQIDPNNVPSLNNLANVTMSRDLSRAIALYRRALELDPDAGFIAYNLAQALNENGSCDEALRLYRRAIMLDPRSLSARHRLGVLLEQRGEFAEAIEQYLAVQRLDPGHVSSLANLMALRHYIPEASMVRRAEEIATLRDITDEDRMKLHRGLGKHYERAADYDRAFGHFTAAKRLLKRSRATFDISAVVKSIDRIMEACSRELFVRHHARISDSQRPVFIVGLPRSGMTVTEQILASHPRVFSAGELQDIPRMVKMLRPDYPECMALMQPDQLNEMANNYLAVVERLAGSRPLRVIDKMPLNSLHLGLIARLFPESRIISCRRDPLDTAVSCFAEVFDPEHDYTTTLEDFGYYFLEHERLMAHWRAVLPIPIHEVYYEALVADPEATCRALIAYCGLDWDRACLDSHESEHALRAHGRREPLHRTSVGRWRHYLPQITPLVKFLESSGFKYTNGARVATATAHRPSHRYGRRWEILPKALTSPLFIVAAPRSGSTLLFETLAHSEHLCSVGGEAHWLIENHIELRPGSPGIDSNRLTASQATDHLRDDIIDQIVARLVDYAGNPVDADGNRIFLEKTPKNALRIPFFDRIFPCARFVFLWRDPRESISSIIEAWRSGRFETYRHVSGFDGPWSLLLPPGYQQLRDRPLEEIAAFQWESTNRIILEDIEALGPERSLRLSYSDLIADAAASVRRILNFASIEVDLALTHHLHSPLPHSRYTQTAPAAGKWRMNEAQIERVLPKVEDTWRRLQSFS